MIPYSVIDAHCDTLTMLEPGQHLLDCPKHYNVQKQSQYARFLQVMDLWVDKGEHPVNDRVNHYVDFYRQEVERTPEIQTILTREDLVHYFTCPTPQNPAWLLGEKALDYETSSEGANLSRGERKKILLTRALLRDAPFLMLDEPLNHLDEAGKQALLLQLEKRGAGLLLISHQDIDDENISLTECTLR